VLKEANRPRLQGRGGAPSVGTGAICFIACVHPRESNELITPRKNFRDFGENDDLNSVSISLLTSVAEGKFR
jgi:hypothetical protein